MKHYAKALFLLIAVMICTAIIAMPSAAEDFEGGFDPERFLVYEGLQARSKNDYAGLRSRYTVDDELVEDLVKEGHTVQYGAMMGIGSYQTTDYRQLSDLAVTYDKTTNKISFNVKNAAIAIVYDSTGVNNPSGLYTARGEIKSSFAYTTTYKHGDMNATMLKDIAMVYRAFIIIDGNVEYVDAVGQTFGKDDATYGRTTSLYEVCDYFATKYTTSSGNPFENSVAIRKVISSCMTQSFKAEFEGGVALTGSVSTSPETVVFENAKAGLYAVKYKYIPNASQGAFYAIRSKESGQVASAKIPFGSGVTEPSWSPVAMYLYLVEGKNTLAFAGSGSQPTLYGVELTLVAEAPVEDTAAIVPSVANTAVTKVNKDNDAGIKTYYDGKCVFLRGDDYATHTLTVKTAGTYDIYVPYNCGGAPVEITANGVTVSANITNAMIPNWNGTDSSKGNSSLSSSAKYVKIESVPLVAGENSLVLKMTGGFITYGALIAVRKTETVTLYDADGTTPISVQKVYDISDVVYPSNVKVPAGYDDVSGWSDLTYDEATGGYSSTVAYVKYYNVDFYDYDKTTLLASMKIVAGSDNAGPDMSGDKTFKGWSTPLSEVNSDCSVYAVKKQTDISVSASDTVLSSASFTKVAEGATYSNFEGYYTVTATETAFKAGEVYTATENGYALALTDTGDTYYALSVTPVKATSSSTLTDYYTYTYTIAEESPVVIAAAKNTDDFYTPATSSTLAAVFFPNVTDILPSTTYVSIFVEVDYTGYYEIDWKTNKMYSHYVSVRNVTTEAQNPNIEAFMTNRVGGNRINNNQYSTYQITGNKANALHASAGASYAVGYLYLAEGLNEIRFFHSYHANNGTGGAFSSIDFKLLREHDVENSVEVEATGAAGWVYETNTVDNFYGTGTGYIRVQPQLTKNQNMPYDFIGNVTLSNATESGVKSATEIPAGKTPKTRAVTLKAGTYQIVEYIGGHSPHIRYTLTKADDASVSVTATSQNNVELMGHSYAAFKECEGPTVVIPEDGVYNLSVVGMSTENYISFAMVSLVPVTEDVTTHTVKFYDGEGNLISVQTVIEGSSAVAPKVETKGFLYWSDDFSAVTEDMSVTAVYDVRYNVEYYDNEGKLLLTESVLKGDAANAPDYTTYKEFKGWSLSPQEYIPIDFSSVTENMKAYMHMRGTSMSVSASDAILASASFAKVAADATYDAYRVYYSVAATEAAFVKGEVYTKDGDTYTLAFADTGATYYALTVTPIEATAETVLTDYYTYSYAFADESPVKTAGTYADRTYAPTTSTADAAMMIPNVGTMANYVTVRVYADYTGLYNLSFTGDTSKMVSWYGSVRNVTSAAENPNIEAYMTNRWVGYRIATGTKSVTKNAAYFLSKGKTSAVTKGQLYLAEGWNEIRITQESNGNNTTVLATTKVTFTLQTAIEDGGVVLEKYTTPANMTHGYGENNTGAGYTRWQNVSLPRTAISNRDVTANAGAYDIYFFGCDSGGTLEYIFTHKETGEAVSVSLATPSKDGGHSYNAHVENKVGSVTLPYDGDYTVTVNLTKNNNYVSFALVRLVPVAEGSHTVSFVDSNGAPISVQTVANGSSATAPDMSGDAGFMRWDTDFSAVTGDMTVRAVRKHTVTFRTHDGVLIVRKETVTGGTVVAPDAPLRDGYLFLGWSKDFSSVTGDISVRATYKEKERFTVTFVDRFDEVLKTETVYTGDAVTPPAYTAPDGYLFLGWSEDTSAVFSNMTVLARTAQKTLSATNVVGTNTTTVAAVEGTSLETIFLPVDSGYIDFNVNADVTGYYGLNLQMNNGGALLNYVRLQNLSAKTYEKNFFGVGRVNAGSSKASVTVDNCMVAVGTGYTNDLLHVYLEKGSNTLRLSTNGGKSVGVAGITLTLKSGDTLDGDYYAMYEKNSFIAAESDISSYEGMGSGNDGQSGGYMLRKERYVTLSETVTITEDGYYALHGVLAGNNSTVTLTDVNDPENVVVFSVASLGNKGGTASSPFWHGNRGKQNIYAGTYKVKVLSHGNHCFTAYYLTREGELDGVYNVGSENASVGEGVTLLENAKSYLMPGTSAGYVEYSVNADRSGMFRVSLAGSTAGVSLKGLYATVNGGRIYTLSPAVFGMESDAYLSASFDDDQCFYLPLSKGENTVRFYTGNGEKMSLAGARFFYEGPLTESEAYTGDDTIVLGTSGAATTLGAGTATKKADHLYVSSTSNTNGADIVYSFTIDSPRVVYFNMNAEAKLGTVLLYVLKDASGKVLRDTFYTVHHDTVGVETLNLDLFEFAAAGEYTLTLKVRRSPTNNRAGAGNESAEIGPKVELKLYSIAFARTAESFASPDVETGDVTHSSVTGATIAGKGAAVTFRNVSLATNAGYALRLLGRVSGGTVVKITYVGEGNLPESDYFHDMLFKVTEVSAIPADNTTVYEYDTRTGKYVLATAYDADTVYYVRSGSVTPSSGTVTFTATESVTATQWLTLGNLNLLADTYTVTVTVEDGSLVIDDMTLVRTADYLRTIELDRSAISTTDENEVRTAILSDNHYVHGEMGGWGDLARQNLMIDMALSEYHTAESLDAVFMVGDLGNFRLNATNTIENGQIYYYSATYLVENVLRRFTENGLPYFATHSGHDYMSSETWYDLFGYEKNYVVVIEDAAYICLDYYYDQADYFAHEPNEAQTDITDEVYEQILAVLNRDDISYASMVIHYSPTGYLPNVKKLTNHPKLNVVFGGHTHANTTQTSVGTNINTTGGALFLQHAHFSIVSGYDDGGKNLINPIINITNEGYYQVFSGVTVSGEAYATTESIGIEYASQHETTKLASGNYATSGRWQTAAYTVDGKKIIFFRDDIRVAKGSYEAIPYNYYLIDGDSVYPVDLTDAVSETYQFTYTGVEATDKSVNGLVYGVDYFKVGVANGKDVVVFPDSYNTTKGGYNLTTTGKTYYLVGDDGSLTLLSGVTVAPHAVAEANRVIEELNTHNNKTIRGYEVSGTPWGMRILERVNGTENDILESYFVYGGYAYSNFYIGYTRVRPSDMAGYIDHLYVLVDVLEKN